MCYNEEDGAERGATGALRRRAIERGRHHLAFYRSAFFSDVLGMCMSMNVILPQQSKRQIGMAAKDAGGKLPTLYLLHGLSTTTASGTGARPLSATSRT